MRKRIFSLLLSMMMAFSFAALNVSAATADYPEAGVYALYTTTNTSQIMVMGDTFICQTRVAGTSGTTKIEIEQTLYIRDDRDRKCLSWTKTVYGTQCTFTNNYVPYTTGKYFFIRAKVIVHHGPIAETTYSVSNDVLNT